MPTESQGPCVVLVTGGSGFLGQHMVGLLQERADHVTEIRVLNIEPYVNKLDYQERLPVRHYTGSINDLDLVQRACEGVTCVIHLASMIDFSMFPDTKRLQEVNVKGTEIIIGACQTAGVKRLIYCSSAEVTIGDSNIEGGTEVSAKPPETFLMEYAKSKHRAETLVLDANSPSLTTVSIRPVAIYGECEEHLVARSIKRVAQSGSKTYRKMRYGNGKQQFVYAGNAAWMFVCAEIEMFQISRGISRAPWHKLGGEAFFCCDDTPILNTVDFSSIFKQACGFYELQHPIPGWIFKYLFVCLYWILWVARIFCDTNIPVGPSVFRALELTWWFKCTKAKELLGYSPLYDWKQSKLRSLTYYSSLCKNN